MKKFNKLVCVGILGLIGLFAGNVFAAQAGFNTPVTNDYSTNWTRVGNVLFYDGYVENTAGEIFAGSTTTSGGTSTFSVGVAETGSYAGDKYFSLYLSPTTAGSVTVNWYGVFGTTTASSGTSNAALLRNPYTYSGTTATSTTFTITQDPTLIAVSVNVTSGTMTITCGMNSIAER